MNEAVVKWFALGTIASVVMGALWLAASVQASHTEFNLRNAGRPAQVTASRASLLPALTLAALPPQQAASSPVASRAQVRVR